MTRGILSDPLTRGPARFVLPTAAAALLAGASHAVAAHDPRGIWLRPERGEQFSFYECGGRPCAKVVSVKKAEDRGSIGTVILRGAVKSGANEWKGKLYNSEDGKTYDGFITVTSPNELTLKGCLWGVLCSGKTWKRVASVSSAAPAPNSKTARQTSVVAAAIQ